MREVFLKREKERERERFRVFLFCFSSFLSLKTSLVTTFYAVFLKAEEKGEREREQLGEREKERARGWWRSEGGEKKVFFWSRKERARAMFLFQQPVQVLVDIHSMFWKQG